MRMRLLLSSLVWLWCSSVYAVDKSVYEGTWQAIFPPIALTIKPNSASFTVSNRITNTSATYTDPTPEYWYGNLATYPFLYLYVKAESNDKRYAFLEHRLYLIMGEEGSNRSKLHLRGYYDLAKVRSDGNGTVENQALPILFERPVQ